MRGRCGAKSGRGNEANSGDAQTGDMLTLSLRRCFTAALVCVRACLLYCCVSSAECVLCVAVSEPFIELLNFFLITRPCWRRRTNSELTCPILPSTWDSLESSFMLVSSCCTKSNSTNFLKHTPRLDSHATAVANNRQHCVTFLRYSANPNAKATLHHG